MDPFLKDLLDTTIAVRLASDPDDAGAETLGDVVILPAHVEAKDVWQEASPQKGRELVTMHFVVVEEKISRQHRVWLLGYGEDPVDRTLAKKPKRLNYFTDPDTLAFSHSEFVV